MEIDQTFETQFKLMTNLKEYIDKYDNTEDNNNQLYKEFTKNTNEVDYLKKHRDYIENENLGFGERAFQFMWYTILLDLAKKNKKIDALEIGVFKGQIISLWALIASKEKINICINGITPLKGNPKPKNKLFLRIKQLFSKKTLEDLKFGNFYENENFEMIIKNLFDEFDLEFDKINLCKGLSTDKNILETFESKKFDIIYIDGDHSFEGTKFDIENYSNLINMGGYLVMDDSACNIPGSVYWKGHQSVSDACEFINKETFRNILNIGHNRIYKRV